MRVLVVVAVASAPCPEDVVVMNPGDDYNAHVNPFEGVVPGEAFASQFFLDVVNHVLYAWDKNYTVWIGTNRSRWQNLFHPTNVSFDCEVVRDSDDVNRVDSGYNSIRHSQRCADEGWCDRYNE